MGTLFDQRSRVAAPEITDIGYAKMSIGSLSTTELVIRGGSDYLEVCDET